ncbi:M15 family metallopeptidase [Dyadobacter jiangsuensis]
MNMRDIRKAHKRLQLAWEHLLIEWGRRHPDLPAPFLTQVFRPRIVQQAYYAQGRQPLDQVNALRKQSDLAPISASENKKRITNSPPGVGKHEQDPAQAIDIAFLKKGSKTELNWEASNFEKAYVILHEFDGGIKWGGHFKTLVDRPHFEI